MLQPFDPNVKTVVLPDASRLHRIGFALVQVYKDRLALIQCGSASLSPTQSRYSTVELECLAIVNAINKCSYSLAGIPRFEVWTDHRPLVGAIEKHLHLMQNQRLMRMREKLTNFNFTVIWTPGKTHHIADALSRAPVFGPCDLHFEPENIERCLRLFDSSMTKMDPAGDKQYTEAMDFIRSGKHISSITNASGAFSFKKVLSQICIDTYNNEQVMVSTDLGTKEVQPKANTQGYHPTELCQTTHAAHSLQLVFRHRKTMAGLGRKILWLDTKGDTLLLESWFNDFGWHTHIQTDGRPQFRPEFKEFCSSYSITHQLSSPYNPESNGWQNRQ